uniref:butyrophilin subfamily 1 member A1-like n=1 Tax=Pristiophorus japonicus TaxID=55135 RepID=UPI00398ECFB9
MEPWALLLILVFGIQSTLAGNFQVVCAQLPTVTIVGATAVLECQLTPNIPLEGMEIRWTKSNVLVHLYRFGLDENAGQDPRYQGRTQLFDREFTSGNVSLNLNKVELLDEGDYQCFVESSTMGFEDAAITLDVASLGQAPAINLFKYAGSGIQLVCDSQQWFPAPTVEWRDQDGQALTQQAHNAVDQNPKLFYKVQSVIEVMPDDGSSFNCLLRNKRLNRTLSAQFHVPVELFPTTSGWLYAFLLIFFSIFGLLAGLLLLFRWQHRQMKDLRKRPKKQGFDDVTKNCHQLAQELETLLDNLGTIRLLSKKAIQRIISVEVPVTLNSDTANPHLKVSAQQTSVSYCAEAKIPSGLGARFETRLSVLGKEGFAAGRHYWRVKVGNNSTWDLGVARESVAKTGKPPLSPENGYWTIGRGGQGYRANGSIASPIAIRGQVHTLGIYVNYEAGTVMFCDAETQSHLCTFTSSFTETIYPFFNLAASSEPLTVCAVPPSS